MKFFHGLAACLLLISLTQAQETTSRFRFWKAIERPAAKDEEIVTFTLDSDIYAATRDGLPDVRVVDETAAEAPYLIESVVEHRQERSRHFFDTRIVMLRPEDNSLEVHLQLPAGSPDAEGFTFATPLRNYERKVQVTGSNDGVKFTPLTDGMIFDYSQYMDVSSREIKLPKNKFREFKLTIADVTDEKESPFKELTRTFKDAKENQRVERTVIERRPFRIDRIGAWGEVTRERVEQPKTARYPVVKFEVEKDAEKKETVILVRTRREPITRFTLETSSRNFSRRVGVEVPTVVSRPDPRKPGKQGKTEPGWQQIAEAQIENFSFRNQKREQLTITIPQRREDVYRIVIHNEDNPPLTIAGVQPEGPVQRVVFLGQPGKSYRVMYGSETAPVPKYEAAAVLANLRQDSAAVVATLAVQTENADFGGEPRAAVRRLLDNWIFLGIAIGVMVAVLGWSLFRAGRRLESLPKE